MRLSSYIGLRFLLSTRQERSIAVITWISGVGVMLGVTALIVTISVMNGFRANLFLAVTGSTPHVRVLPRQGPWDVATQAAMMAKVAAQPGVEAVAPYFSRQVFLRVAGQYRAIVLRGIDPALEPRVSEIARFVRGDSLTVSADAGGARLLAELPGNPAAGERAGIILGAPVARALGLIVGDELDAISTVERQTPIGPVPLIKKLRLIGLFETGLGGTDDVSGFADQRTAQQLFRLPNLSGVAARVKNAENIDAAAWHQAFPEARVVTWADENRNIFQVMRLEKLGLFVILTLILVVSFFNIISSLVMLVLEKRKGIGVLMSLGASRSLIRRIFLMQGFWIATLGTAAGLTLGLAACWALATFDVVRLPPGVFPLGTRLPVLVELSDVLAITAASFLICLLVTLFPASQAARTNPVETLRWE
jgi:lipoprotein-releasing system permease protein